MGQEGWILKSEYDALIEALDDEKNSHLETKSKLAVTKEKLDFALGEIEILNKQLKKEKEVFHEAFGHLKDTAFEQKYHTLLFKQKYEDIETFCQQQDGMLIAKDAAIKDLRGRLSQQKKIHKKELDDKNIHLLQERYLAQNCLLKRHKGVASEKIKKTKN